MDYGMPWTRERVAVERNMTAPILRVEGLRTHFRVREGALKAVDDISFAVEPGKVLGIVGESGSGKSVTALSILRLIDPPGKIEGGRIFYRDNDLLELPEAEMTRTIRGNRIGMIFQDPMTSLIRHSHRRPNRRRHHRAPAGEPRASAREDPRAVASGWDTQCQGALR